MADQIFKCKVCGGQAKWDPVIQKVKCEFCDSEFELSDFEEQKEDDTYQVGQDAVEQGYVEANDESGNVDPKDLRVYKCKYCGAEIITDKTTMATHCVFCNNPVVLEEQLATEFKPKWIIPFKIPRDKIEEMYLNYIKKPFTPDAFLSPEHIKQIKGVYIPFWLYNIDVKGYLQANAQKTRNYSDSRYNYTEYKVYDVERDGIFKFSKIPVDASSKTPNDAMDSIEPFDFNDIKPFALPYLSGFLAERYDETQDDCKDRAQQRANQTTQQLLMQSIAGYTSVSPKNSNIEILNTEAEYTMLPTYLLFTRYKDEDYVFAVNGQTGKLIGNVPIDEKKKKKFFLKNFGIIFSILSILGTILTFLGLFNI